MLTIRAPVHLDGAVVVVGQVGQRRSVLAQSVVAGVGVVVVVTVRNICRPKQTHGITSAAVKLPQGQQNASQWNTNRKN